MVGFAADLGFAWASRRIWVSRWASWRSQVDPVSAIFLSRPDPVSALSLPPQIRSQLERKRRCRLRFGLSWRGEGGAAPDPVSAREEKAVGPCCYAVEDLSKKKSINR